MTSLGVPLERFKCLYNLEIDFRPLSSKYYKPIKFLFFTNFIAYGPKNDSFFVNIKKSKKVWAFIYENFDEPIKN